LPVRPEQLTFGDNKFTVQLVSASGTVSGPETFSIALQGNGAGAPPRIVSIAPLVPAWSRPVGQFSRISPLFKIEYADPEADIARLRLRVSAPDGNSTVIEDSAEGLGLSGAAGTVSVPLVMFDQTKASGAYLFEVTLIDQGGHVSASATATLMLLADSGAPSLTITDFSPAVGGAGTVITVRGTGFDTNSPTANRVTVSTVEAEVLEVRTNELKIVVPEVRGSGGFASKRGKALR
jgi:hypothetical protein